MTDAVDPVTEAELHAYFDGELSPERRGAVEAYLGNHPEDADRLESYRGQDILIRRAYRTLAERPLSPRLLGVVTRRETPHRRGWWQALAAAAAGLVLFVRRRGLRLVWSRPACARGVAQREPGCGCRSRASDLRGRKAARGRGARER